MRSIWEFLMFWIHVSNKYDRLKNSPKAEKSVKFGVTSLALSILGIFVTVGFAALAYTCFSVDGLEGLVAVIGGAICVLAAITCFIYMILASIVYAAYQMRLNKRRIGVVALIVSLFIIIATICSIIFVIAF